MTYDVSAERSSVIMTSINMTSVNMTSVNMTSVNIKVLIFREISLNTNECNSKKFYFSLQNYSSFQD